MPVVKDLEMLAGFQGWDGAGFQWRHCNASTRRPEKRLRVLAVRTPNVVLEGVCVKRGRSPESHNYLKSSESRKRMPGSNEKMFPLLL